ncbi:1-phosphofructokinase family hexose kinase [Mycoplasma capricolum subsp. capripneumoniae]|uniref:1-phosphofructokinase n=1 Tax=Mycoplasma capricolum TaxID=2095 RepID=UPI0014051C30|nr:1-phosphofructokinase family hexose kinase [Mycoplasma capricolum]QIN44076.1 1-phosphofructokinase family hexose kinase [Mycoplasma capricolum subsp. capripneumoniae]QIN44759.1 1-phosphofructokinase family hexose kinase [Mycoplasma capricolum subsp. capripneumoniae]
MIYTITLNPAIDCVIETNQIDFNNTNYYSNGYSLIGGKGINVAIILNNLKNDVISTGFLGKNNANQFLDKFLELNLKNHFFLYNGVTRTNFKIKNLNTFDEIELNGVGCDLKLSYLNKLLKYLKDNLKEDDIVIASGSANKSFNDNVYQIIGNLVNKKQALFILDTSKKYLLEGLKAKPFLIKQNISELFAVFNEPISYEFDLIYKKIKQLQSLGARNILLSMASKGSYYFSESNDIYKIGVGQGKLVNSIGVGDSMLAGFVHGLNQQLDIIKTLKYAASCGSSTAFNKWLATKKEINKQLKNIEVKKIER